MRIGIVGAGAMGGLFGARLLVAGHSVSFIEVSHDTIHTIRNHGLQLHSTDENVCLWPEIGVADHFERPFELMIVFTKGFHTARAIADVRHLVDLQTWVVSVQNGLGNAELISKVVGADRIIVGMTDFPADLKSAGIVHSHGQGHIRLWSYTGKTLPGVSDVAEIFDQAGLHCVADPDVQIAIWEKLAFNVALNSICSVASLSVGELGAAPGGPALVSSVVEEVVAVAESCGVSVSLPRIMATINHAFANHVSHKPSMLQDLEAGRKTENSFIAGAVVNLGNAKGISVPVTHSLFTLVNIREQQLAR